MAVLDFLDFILDLPPLVGILAISVFVSAVTTIIYKYTTNQRLMKEIKEDVKRMQSEVRTTKDTARIAALQKQMMSRSMQQLSSSMKSTFITFIPLLMLFGWMQANMAYTPITPGEEFTTTAQFANASPGLNITLNAGSGLEMLDSPVQEVKNGIAVWRLKSGTEGAYSLAYSLKNETYNLSVLVTEQFRYENPVLMKPKGISKNSQLAKITVDLQPLRPFGEFSLFGWRPGWLATYIILSLIFSTLMRKLLNAH